MIIFSYSSFYFSLMFNFIAFAETQRLSDYPLPYLQCVPQAQTERIVTGYQCVESSAEETTQYQDVLVTTHSQVVSNLEALDFTDEMTDVVSLESLPEPLSLEKISVNDLSFVPYYMGMY